VTIIIVLNTLVARAGIKLMAGLYFNTSILQYSRESGAKIVRK